LRKDIINVVDVYKICNSKVKKNMVKINISIEGEDMEEIFTEMISVGTKSIKSNRNELKELIEIFANEFIDVLVKRNIL
jgi:acetolactate synthase small subunit